MMLFLACLLCFSFCTYSKEITSIDFDKSMAFDVSDPYHKKEKPVIEFFRWLYERNKNLKPREDAIIPKRVHVIWVGPHEPPAHLGKCLKSIQKFLPTWDYKLWTDDDIPGLNLKNQRYYDQATTYAEKADILRYELLYRYGGVYLDSDIELLKPLDVLHHTYEFYAGILPTDVRDDLNNAVKEYLKVNQLYSQNAFFVLHGLVGVGAKIHKHLMYQGGVA